MPYGWAALEAKWPGHAKEMAKVVTHSAIRTAAAVTGTNLVGEITKGHWAGRVYGGRSLVCDSNGMILATLADRDRDRDVRVVPVELPRKPYCRRPPKPSPQGLCVRNYPFYG